MPATGVPKAVIPAAGLGTRFLPATKSQPKEMLPVVDKPGIQYVVEEAVRAGIEDVLLIGARGKTSMEDHFDRSIELEDRLEAAGKLEEAALVRSIAELAAVHSVRQKEPLGFGHAVLQARPHVGDSSFAVLVGDEIVPEPIGEEAALLPRMIELHRATGKSVVAFQEVPRAEISSYGVLAPGERLFEDALLADDMVEKPALADAPSNLAARGRYVLTPDIFASLDETEPGVGGEIQLTDALRRLAGAGEVVAYVHRGPIYDVGKKLDYLKATIELALRRADLAEPLRDHLIRRADQLRGAGADEVSSWGA